MLSRVCAVQLVGFNSFRVAGVMMLGLLAYDGELWPEVWSRTLLVVV